MKNFLVLTFIFWFQVIFACHSITLKQGLRAAIAENKLVVIYFSDNKDFNFCCDKNLFIHNLEAKKISENFINVMVNESSNIELIKRYKVSKFPTLIILDGNGFELNRNFTITNELNIVENLENFSSSIDFLSNDLKNYNQKQSYTTAIRVAQKYIDYALKVETSLGLNFVTMSELYLDLASKEVKKKDNLRDEKLQRIELLKLIRVAFYKNYQLLTQKILEIEDSSVFENNKSLYTFFEYIALKGLQSNDFELVENKIIQFEDADYLITKANLILERSI